MDYASKKNLKKMDDATSTSSTPVTCIASLPQEIILKILTCLPPKSAVSFRCTSKFFYSFIPKPHFAFRILFWFSSTNLYTVTYTTEESNGRLQPSSLQCSADELQRFKRLIGSSFADGNYYSSWVKLNGLLTYIYVDVMRRTRIFVYTLEKLGPGWDKHEVALTLEEAKIISQAQSVSITANSIGEIVFLIRARSIPPSVFIYASGTQVWRKFEIYGLPSYSSFENWGRINIVHVMEEKVYSSE